MADNVNRISSLILQTPPGEINEVANDLKALVGESLISNECLSAFVQHDNEAFVEVKIDDGKPNALITKYGQVTQDPNQYQDHTNKVVFQFNHIKQKKESQTALTIDANVEKDRILIENHLKTYLNEFYEKCNFAVYGFEDKEHPFVVCTESHIFKPKNFWNGQIKSEFKVDVNGSSMVINGELKTKIHYFEDGNVQMFSDRNVQTSIPIEDPEKNAKEIVNFIKKEESAYQEAQLNQLSDMMESTFKALRRQLPITRTKVDWANIAAYSIGKNIVGHK